MIAHPPFRHDIEPNSDHWHDFRSHHCNASEAAAALNIGHFEPKTAARLAEVRNGTRPKVVYAAAVNHGHRHEETVRAQIEARLSSSIVPSVWSRLVNGIPLACSTDGISDDGYVIEIKCPISETSEVLLAARAGEVPKYYMAQVQQQMLVTDCAKAFFVVREPSIIDPSTGLPLLHFIFVERDEAWAIRIVEAWEKLWPHLQAGTVPAAEGERTDGEWLLYAEEYLTLKAQADAIEARIKETRNELIRLAEKTDGKAIGGGVIASKKNRAGTVDYKSIPELQGVDLSPYRSKPTTYWSIDLEKAA